MTPPYAAAAVMVAAEIFESRWQAAPSVGKMLERVRDLWHRHLFVLFLMHPSLWWVLYLYTERGFHGALLGAVVVMKGSDLAFKIWMVKKLEEAEAGPGFRAMLAMPVPGWMTTINVLIYPVAVYAALV